MATNTLQDKHQQVRVPFVQSQRSGAISVTETLGGQLFYNVIPMTSKNHTTKEKEYLLHKRPPITKKIRLSTHITGTASSAQGMTNMGMSMLDDVCVCAIYDAVAVHPVIRIIQYRPAAGTSVLIGSISNANTTGGVDVTADDEVFITEGEVVDGGNIVPGIAITWKKYASSYSDGFWAKTSAGVFTAASLTKITAASFPVTLGKIITGPFQQLNGIFYVMGTDGVIYGSGGSTGIVNDLTQWDSNNTIRCRQTPDAGIGVFRYKHHLVAFGNSSIEFFSDVGNAVPASALAVTEQAFIKFGTFSAKHVANIHDTLYWIAASLDNQNGLFKLDGYTPIKISDSSLDTALNSRSVKGYLGSVLISGKIHLVINQSRNMVDGWPPFSALSPGDYWYVGGVPSSFSDSTLDTNYWQYGSANASFAGDLHTTNFCYCYNIEDDIWWFLGGKYLDIILPTSSTTTSTKDNTNYILFRNYNNTYMGDTTTVYEMKNSMTINNAQQDGDGASSESLSPYPVYISSGITSFGTMNRKRVNKIQLVPVYIDITQKASIESFHIGIKRGAANSFEMGSPTGWYRTVLPTGETESDDWSYTVYNLGTCRSMQFMFYYYGKCHIVLEGLDVTLTVGDH